MFGTRTVRFEPVKTSRQKSGKCPVCGKRVVRRKTFEHTVNPFNKNKDGSVRTFEEVLNRVNEEADNWQPDFCHDKCK